MNASRPTVLKAPGDPAQSIMEQYWMFCGGIGKGCKSIQCIEALYDCRRPRLKRHSESFFGDVEKTDQLTFFSRKRVNEVLNEKRVADLLKCQCEMCEECREDHKFSSSYDQIDYVKQLSRPHDDGRLVMAALVSLGKMHLIHKWSRYFTYILSTIRRPDGTEELNPFLPNDRDHKWKNELFWNAYGRTIDMLSPAKLSQGPSKRPLHQAFPDHQRFPYLPADRLEPVIPPGSSGSLMTTFSVSEEYIDESLREVLDHDYASSVQNDEDGKKYLLVRKVLKSRSLRDMEHVTLRTIAELRNPNLIVLIQFYEWRKEFHFVFPHVETHLDKVLLDEDTGPINIQELFRSSSPLADNKLWHQMQGVCEALKTIHFDLACPWKSSDQVMIFHFDLKPANLLVTANGIVKITDFGHSMIQVLRPEEEKKGPYMGGDPAYRAPESETGVPNASEVEKAKAERSAQPVKQELSTRQLPVREVFLNYDVWQLACIMIEVLIWISEKDLDQGMKGHAIKEFRKAKRHEDGRDCFYRKGDLSDAEPQDAGEEQSAVRLKDIIAAKLREHLLKHSETESRASVVYQQSMNDLLVDMFSIEPLKRCHSNKALTILEDARTTYFESLESPVRQNRGDIREWTEPDSW